MIAIYELEKDLTNVNDHELTSVIGGGVPFIPIVLGGAAGGAGYITGKASSNAINGKEWNDGMNPADLATATLAGAVSPVNSATSFGLSTLSSFISADGVDNMGKQTFALFELFGEGASAIRG
jgi:hypothetical protein